MKKKIVLSAGGTGGHLFPAQSVARALPNWEAMFIAGGLKNNRYFDRDCFSFEEIECATFSMLNPMCALKGCKKILKGVGQSRKLLQRYTPDLVIGFGSFFTLPVLAAALLEKVPFILHEQNAVPGRVNRLFSPFASATAITFPITRSYLKKNTHKKVVEVAFPLRKSPNISLKECWNYFNLQPSYPTLLIFGGSQGANSLNTLFLEAIKYFKNCQVLHFVGNEEGCLKARKLYQALSIPACVKAFEPFIERAMRIADLAITRAGASTIAELIEYELPALLIPYPYATDNHQEKNGIHFISQVKAGKMYKESDLSAVFLAQLFPQMLQKLPELKKNISHYKNDCPHLQLTELIEGGMHE